MARPWRWWCAQGARLFGWPAWLADFGGPRGRRFAWVDELTTGNAGAGRKGEENPAAMQMRRAVDGGGPRAAVAAGVAKWWSLTGTPGVLASLYHLEAPGH
nr:unnamed protein product [Digitaria exilis]